MNEHQFIDARPSNRFNCEVDEPRQGCIRGRISGAINFPFIELYSDFKKGIFKSRKEVEKMFTDYKIDMNNKSKIWYCGSGMTACIGILWAEELGASNNRLYDGSWA